MGKLSRRQHNIWRVGGGAPSGPRPSVKVRVWMRCCLLFLSPAVLLVFLFPLLLGLFLSTQTRSERYLQHRRSKQICSVILATVTCKRKSYELWFSPILHYFSFPSSHQPSLVKTQKRGSWEIYSLKTTRHRFDLIAGVWVAPVHPHIQPARSLSTSSTMTQCSLS